MSIEDKNQQDKPKAYRVEDDNNLEEKDLERTFLFGDDEDIPADTNREGQGMGGDHFGDNNLTPSGDDKDNPSQNAGYTNAYFKRTEPAEEHPENENFVADGQQGSPDVADANGNYSEKNKAETLSQNEGVNKFPNPQSTYQEGTVDQDNDLTTNKSTPHSNNITDEQRNGGD